MKLSIYIVLLIIILPWICEACLGLVIQQSILNYIIVIIKIRPWEDHLKSNLIYLGQVSMY